MNKQGRGNTILEALIQHRLPVEKECMHNMSVSQEFLSKMNILNECSSYIVQYMKKYELL